MKKLKVALLSALVIPAIGFTAANAIPGGGFDPCVLKVAPNCSGDCLLAGDACAGIQDLDENGEPVGNAYCDCVAVPGGGENPEN